ncbi:replication protein, partial [Pantoea endophytica]
MATAELLDFNAARKLRSARMENQKQGHFALFRSLLSKDWAKDTAKLAMWIRLIGEASYRPRTVEFSGKEWNLQPGELVTTAAIMGRKLRDQDSHEKSPQAVTRMINFFAREGMITTKGTRFGTVITITNYAEYQAISPDEPRERPSDNNKPSTGAALSAIPDEPSEEPTGEQNKKLLEQEFNNNYPHTPKGGR